MFSGFVLQRLAGETSAGANKNEQGEPGSKPKSKPKSVTHLLPDLLFAGVPLLVALNAYFPDLAYEIREWLALRGTLRDFQ
jgi:hypothetical protein